MLPLRARVDLGANGNEGVLRIPQSSSIAGTSPSDCLVSYPGYSLAGVLPLCREAVGVFYSPSRLGKEMREISSTVGITGKRLTLFQGHALSSVKYCHWMFMQTYPLFPVYPYSLISNVVCEIPEITTK